jgi:hypothetical protein
MMLLKSESENQKKFLHKKFHQLKKYLSGNKLINKRHLCTVPKNELQV